MAESAEKIDIRCICLDVDGVLTDGHLFMNDAGVGTRMFHVHDGFALRWFRKLGGEVVVCSGKRSEAVTARMRELGIEHVIQGSRDKLADVQALLEPLKLKLEHVAAIGDDLPDLPLLLRCGFPIAVANAVDEVKAQARLVTERRGGQGAVREAVEYLLRAAGRWPEVLESYGVPGAE